MTVASTPPAFTLHSSFDPLISLYDYFLLDQFGVIHNGSRPLRGAAGCIRELSRRNKRMAILSNTSSPSHVALRRLPKYGLREDMFAGGLVSSGEECAKYVGENYCRVDGGGRGPNGGNVKKALWFTWKDSEKQNPLQFLEHCEHRGGGGRIDIAESVEEADLILLHGSEVWRRRRELPDAGEDELAKDLHFMYDEDCAVLDPVLGRAAEMNLPMVCANPDLIVGLPGGIVGNMPGKIARRYESMGGNVRHFGKPAPHHFHACLDNLGVEFDPKERIPGVAHVGDSLEHDVAGANAAGIDSVFVLGGIHAKELGLNPTGTEECAGDEDVGGRREPPSKRDLVARLESYFEEKSIWPTHVVPSLSLHSNTAWV